MNFTESIPRSTSQEIDDLMSNGRFIDFLRYQLMEVVNKDYAKKLQSLNRMDSQPSIHIVISRASELQLEQSPIVEIMPSLELKDNIDKKQIKRDKRRATLTIKLDSFKEEKAVITKDEPAPENLAENIRTKSELKGTEQNKEEDFTFIENFIGLGIQEVSSKHDDNQDQALKFDTKKSDSSQPQELLQITQNYLSPIKQGFQKKNYDQDDMSPMSSNISSFYFDRIEELLPEKKLIAEKLYKNSELKPSTTSVFSTPINIRSKSPVRSRFRKRLDKSMSDFQKEKEELKYNLMQFRTAQEYQKDKDKKNSAQALKFLRKLGRKLRMPQTVMRGITKQRGPFGNFEQNQEKSFHTNESAKEDKVSPRQALMKQQNIKHQGVDAQNDNPFFGFQVLAASGSEERVSLNDSGEKGFGNLFKSANQGNNLDLNKLNNFITQCDDGRFSFDIFNPYNIKGVPQFPDNAPREPDDLGRCVSFAPYNMTNNPSAELYDMQSPIVTRNQIKAELDDVEEEVMDAIKEYREKDFYNDFNTYKNYYQDALQSNLFDEKRDNTISFKDARFFINPVPEQRPSINNTGSNSHLPQAPMSPIMEELDMNLDKEISKEDRNPFIDQSQPAERSPSLNKSEKKSPLSVANCKEINFNLKQLSSLLESGVISQNKSSRQKGSFMQVIRTEQDQTDERGQFNFSSEKKRPYTLNRNRSAKESGMVRSKSPVVLKKNLLKDFLSDKKALKQVSMNIKLLHDDLMHSKNAKKRQPTQNKLKKTSSHHYNEEGTDNKKAKGVFEEEKKKNKNIEISKPRIK